MTAARQRRRRPRLDRRGARRRRHLAPRAGRGSRLGLLLAAPLGWLVIAYLGALFILLLNAFWAKDAFTGKVEPFNWSLAAFQTLVSNPVYRTIAMRTIGMAIARHDHRRAARVPDRLLHGPDRVAAERAACSSSRS